MGVDEMRAAATASIPVDATNRFRMDAPSFFSSLLPGERLFAPLAVQQFFHELHALEIHELRVLLLPPVQRHGDLPGSRENVAILDCRFVGDHIRTRTRIAL